MSQYNSQESVLPPPFLQVENQFFSKSAPGKISLSMVLVLYKHELGKTEKKTTVMSISPWIGRQTVVSVCLSCLPSFCPGCPVIQIFIEYHGEMTKGSIWTMVPLPLFYSLWVMLREVQARIQVSETRIWVSENNFLVSEARNSVSEARIWASEARIQVFEARTQVLEVRIWVPKVRIWVSKAWMWVFGARI